MKMIDTFIVIRLGRHFKVLLFLSLPAAEATPRFSGDVEANVLLNVSKTFKIGSVPLLILIVENNKVVVSTSVDAVLIVESEAWILFSENVQKELAAIGSERALHSSC
jgi:hypothetical protein